MKRLVAYLSDVAGLRKSSCTTRPPAGLRLVQHRRRHGRPLLLVRRGKQRLCLSSGEGYRDVFQQDEAGGFNRLANDDGRGRTLVAVRRRTQPSLPRRAAPRCTEGGNSHLRSTLTDPTEPRSAGPRAIAARDTNNGLLAVEIDS